MKNPKIFLVIVALSLCCSPLTLGQTPEKQRSESHAPVLRSGELPENPRPERAAPGRCRPQGRCAPSPPCCPYPPRPSYPPSWFAPEEGDHAALGALVGFTVLGIAGGVGAQTDPRGKVAVGLFTGSLGALIGVAVGHSIPAPYRHHWRHRFTPPEDEEMAKGRPNSPESSAERTP